jgi:membrane protein implicated in regulation of membrane protease activity
MDQHTLNKKASETQLLFQTYIEDLRYCKKQQWYVLYLVVIANAAIISLRFAATHENITVVGICLQQLLACVSLIIFVIGSIFVFMFWEGILKFRSLKTRISDTFEELPRKISKGKPGKDYDANVRDFRISFGFIIAMLFATLISFLVLLQHNSSSLIIFCALGVISLIVIKKVFRNRNRCD